jgi:allophanate hydrolase
MRPAYAFPSLDLKSLARVYQSGEASPKEVACLVLARIAAYPDPAVWIHLLERDEILAQVGAIEKRREAGERLPLFGVPFAIKDSIDLAGHPTTAGCPAYSYVPERSATVVERLLKAGAIAIGKANLDQFGTGLAGDRTPYGACRNVFNPEFISGGSSSGSAVAVAAGLVSFALGTDTAGSGRVPAAANNIVGLKPTPGLLSTAGLVPSCASLDCISFMTLTADDSAFLLSIAQGQDSPPAMPGDGHLTTFATPAESALDFCGDQESAEIFRKSLERLEGSGARRITVDFAPFREAGLLLYGGPWVAERLGTLEAFMSAHSDEMHPVTRKIIAGGSQYRAVDLFRAQQRLKILREICLRVFDQAEILVVPTIPTLPKTSDVAQDSVLWSRRLGTYTNFANLLGLSAVAVPAAFTALGLPAGLTLIGPAGSERRLCEIGMAWQRQIDLPLGATGHRLPAAAPRPVPRPSATPEGYVRVSVAGAHLQGQPFHAALCRLGARFVRACRTAAKYRFFAFLELDPPRPGLLRADERGGAIAVEIYDLPLEGFGRLVASVAPPLAIGTVELEDGESVKGFLCESCATRRARDITDFGGWVAFRSQNSRSSATQKPAPC